ncbi:MAG: RNA polymerase sigma factor [Psychroserpens sp.]|uniref:RNA polymerase sigma factor n=1 Tax=Psychroserpens sp. TaxID=2020870 RepID=UPI003C91E005
MFLKKYDTYTDKILISESVSGNTNSLSVLIKKHQDFIYNISLRFFLNPEDALDATQDILIKIINNLKNFSGQSAFRTWVYRIAINHYLNAPKSKTERLLNDHSQQFSGFSDADERNSFSEEEVEEVRVLCSTAMLMCLNREQRLLYIMGEVFGVDHNLGSQLFDVSKANYRIKLHRARLELTNFVTGKCGIINPKNPCRCPKKTRTFINNGIIDKNNLRFTTDFKHTVATIVETQKEDISDKIQLDLRELFQNSPFQVKEEIDDLLNFS